MNGSGGFSRYPGEREWNSESTLGSEDEVNALHHIFWGQFES